jgi:GntR family transcriptional regulator/MocR family aminotransferase
VELAVVPESLVETFEIAQRHTGQLVSETLQDALAAFMDDGAYAAHIRRMTRLYRARRDRMVEALAAEAGNAFMVEPPAGGMQVLARCSLRQDDRRLCARLAEAGVTARPLSSHYIGETAERGLFLGFAAWTDREIDAGARLIGRVCRP